MSKPKNWPEPFPYLKSPLHSKTLTKSHVQTLRTKPPSLPSIPSPSTPTPSPLVKIQTITNPSHPAHTQHGLFAASSLKPGTFIIPYLGRVHTSADTDEGSDYDIWLDREGDVAVDASREGNEGRFVNDYRGVGERANAEFGNVWCERWGQVCVGIWVRKGGGKKGKDEGIKKGEEIFVSYGKGFWEKRIADEEAKA